MGKASKETLKERTEKNQSLAVASNKVFRSGLATDNPVIVVPSPIFKPWDLLPRVAFMEQELKGLYPKPEVKGYMNKHIQLAPPNYFQQKEEVEMTKSKRSPKQKVKPALPDFSKIAKYSQSDKGSQSGRKSQQSGKGTLEVGLIDDVKEKKKHK